jgi:hypothetical protein
MKKNQITQNNQRMKNRISKTKSAILPALLFVATALFFNHQLLAQQVLKGPYLLEPGDKNMTIRYEFDSQGDYVLAYGTKKTATKELKLSYRGSRHGGHLYTISLTGLKPNTTYYYRLANPATDEWFSFKTFKTNQAGLSFVAMGDSRSKPEIFSKIMKASKDIRPDFIISMGDLVEVGAAYEQWQDFYFSVVKGFVESTPIVSTLGDHETNGDDGDLFRYFLRDEETVDKQWFSFDYGDAHFISLDFRHPDDREMMDWFVNDITAAGKKWNFVFMHRGAYNFGGHRTDWGREFWPGLFSKYKVDIVFAGHSHLYERFYPGSAKGAANAVTYITTGGAGAGLYQSVKNKTIVAVTESVNNFVSIKIDGNRLDMLAKRMDGSLLDELVIVKDRNGYNAAYKAQIVSLEQMNTITGFNSAISADISAIPLFEAAAKYELKLQSSVDEDIPFRIQLTEESAQIYSMEVCQDTLRAHEKKKAVLLIGRHEDMTVHPWGDFDPALRLKIVYQYQEKTDTIVGKEISYFPGQ